MANESPLPPYPRPRPPPSDGTRNHERTVPAPASVDGTDRTDRFDTQSRAEPYPAAQSAPVPSPPAVQVRSPVTVRACASVHSGSGGDGVVMAASTSGHRSPSPLRPSEVILSPDAEVSVAVVGVRGAGAGDVGSDIHAHAHSPSPADADAEAEAESEDDASGEELPPFPPRLSRQSGYYNEGTSRTSTLSLSTTS